jgi:hypothetical protein
VCVVVDRIPAVMMHARIVAGLLFRSDGRTDELRGKNSDYQCSLVATRVSCVMGYMLERDHLLLRCEGRVAAGRK